MEILDKKIEINTYTDLISNFKEVIAVLGKTRIKILFHTSGCDDFIDGELYIVFEDNRTLVIANKLTKLIQKKLPKNFRIIPDNNWDSFF